MPVSAWAVHLSVILHLALVGSRAPWNQRSHYVLELPYDLEEIGVKQIAAEKDHEASLETVKYGLVSAAGAAGGAEKGMQDARTLCGTPNYSSPGHRYEKSHPLKVWVGNEEAVEKEQE